MESERKIEVNLSALKQDILDKKITPSDFLDKMRRVSKGVSRVARRYFHEEAKPIRLYRARVFNGNFKKPEKITELSYIPDSTLCKVGRANSEGEQIFYASAGLPTTFVEMKDAIKINSIVIVSEWRSRDSIILQQVGFVESRDKKSEYEQFLHDIFTFEGSELYPYSSALSQHLIGSKIIDGIMYPSIESQNQSQNLALKKETIDEKFEFAYAYVYRVKEIKPNFQYDVDKIDFILPEGDSLKYKEGKEQWVIREDGGELKMHGNGWGWDAYSSDGKLVDPE